MTTFKQFIDEESHQQLSRAALHSVARRVAASLVLKPNGVRAFRDLADGPDQFKFQLTTQALEPKAMSDKFVDTIIAQLAKERIKARFDGVEFQHQGKKYIETTITASFAAYPE